MLVRLRRVQGSTFRVQGWWFRVAQSLFEDSQNSYLRNLIFDAYSPPLEDSIFDWAESFDPELTTEGLVAGCGSLFPAPCPLSL